MKYTPLSVFALLGCSIHTQSPVVPVAYDFNDYYYYDRAYAPSPSAGIFLANGSPVYRVEYRDGSLWTTQGVYYSEKSAMQALMNNVGRKTGRLWRMTCEDAGKVLVLALVQG